jgi:hypothetical protein
MEAIGQFACEFQSNGWSDDGQREWLESIQVNKLHSGCGFHQIRISACPKHYLSKI